MLRVVELQPKSVEAQARLGAGFLAAGDQELGIATLKDLLAADPGYEQADILIVLNFLRARQADAAVEAAEDYRDRNPESTTSYSLLGRAYVLAGRKEDAWVAFQKALSLRPDDPDANNSLAALKLEERDFEGARHFYQRVLGFRPRPARPDLAHAVITLKKGSPAVRVLPWHLLAAGKDATGADRFYAPTTAVIVNTSRVASVRSVLFPLR